jgi:DNA-binding response OmpR family regulator
MNARIVVVDSDPFVGRLLPRILADEGYETVVVPRGRDAVGEIAGHERTVALLEVDLPDIDGFRLAEELRARRYNGPIIFLTNRCALDDKLEGFRVGADDYITKPYEPVELLARIQCLVRRYHRDDRQSMGSVVRVSDAELSLRDLTYASEVVQPVILTPTEMRVLECLMRNPAVVLSRDALVDRIWGYDFYGDTNRIEVYIRRVRRKIEVDPTQPRYLHTVRGIGYVFRPEPAGATWGVVESLPAASWPAPLPLPTADQFLLAGD